jgi:hypothetical protein
VSPAAPDDQVPPDGPEEEGCDVQDAEYEHQHPERLIDHGDEEV